MKKISVIIPVFNEANGIEDCLLSLKPLQLSGHELIVVDGGSNDDTVALAKPFADRVIRSSRGRARQMNTGAALGSGDLYLFLHADTQFTKSAAQTLISVAEESTYVWGRFDVRLSGGHSLFRVIEAAMNLRSRMTSVCTGDQAIFVDREMFIRVGGYDDIGLMEDIALSKKLRRHMSPLCLHEKLITSSRRWESDGILRTVFRMWWLRLAYFLGSSPERLRRHYHYYEQR